MDTNYPNTVVDLARARLEQLEREELLALAVGVSDHLPIELVLRVEAIRRERRELLGEPRSAAAA